MPALTEQSMYPPVEVLDIDALIAAAGPGDVTFDPPLRRIAIGVAGTLKIDTPNNTGVTIDANALVIGVQHELSITKIYSASGATQVWGFR